MHTWPTVDSISIIGHQERTNLFATFRPDVTLIHGANGTFKTTLLHYLANVTNFDLDALFALRFERLRALLSTGMEIEIVAKRQPWTSRDTESLTVNLNGEELVEVRPGFPVNELKPQMSSFLQRTGLRPPTYLPAFRTLIEAADYTQGRLPDFTHNSNPDSEAETRLRNIEEMKGHIVNREMKRTGQPRLRRDSRAIVRKTLFARSFFGEFVPVIGYPILGEVQLNLTRTVRRAKYAVANYEREFLIRTIHEIFSSALSQSTDFDVDPKSILEELPEVLIRLNKVVDSSGTLVGLAKTVEQAYHWLAEDGASREGLSIVSSLVKALQGLFQSIDETMAPLRSFEKSANGFLDDKALSLTDVSYEPSTMARGRFVVLNDGSPIRLSQLSSGERHVISLLACAEFHTEDGGMLIIDEPEISLHVDWQRRILPEILRRLSNTQVVVATHSPEVAASFRDGLTGFRVEPWKPQGPAASHQDSYLGDQRDFD